MYTYLHFLLNIMIEASIRDKMYIWRAKYEIFQAFQKCWSTTRMSRNPYASSEDGFGAHITKNQKATIKENTLSSLTFLDADHLCIQPNLSFLRILTRINILGKGWEFTKENKKVRSLSWSRACFLSLFLGRKRVFLFAISCFYKLPPQLWSWF